VRLLLALLPLLLTVCELRPYTRRSPCSGGFDGSFVQLGERDMARGPEEWKAELQTLRSVGIVTVVLQYSGDELGSYDRTPEHQPVRSLLAAADELDLQVLLGLYSDQHWPNDVPGDDWLPPPLGDPGQREQLFALCAAHRSCAGWYLPQEIDDSTWGSSDGARRIARLLSASVALLREARPRRPIAIAPFFTETLPPEAYAGWWDHVLKQAPIEILMIQDGTGARGTSTATVAQMLEALAPMARRRGVELWSIVEIFQQTGGPPLDEADFSAVPASFDQVSERLRVEQPRSARSMAFSLLDYMAPQRGEPQRVLYQQYLNYCR
jgi:hypothetical protein